MSNPEIPTTLAGYAELIEWLDDLKSRPSGANSDSAWADALRWYAENDLYFMLRHILLLGDHPHQPSKKPIYDHQIYIDQCRAVEYFFQQGRGVNASARGLSKSEILCALAIQTFVKYPDVAIGLYSVEKTYGHKHLVRLRTELEKNPLLKLLFEDLLWEDPVEEAKNRGVTWSKQDGLVIRGRKMNRSVPSFEVNTLYGHGEVGSRYDLLFLDDVETRDTVESEEKIKDLEVAISTATSLLTPVALPRPVVIYANTRFSESGVVHKKAEAYRKIDPKLVLEIPAEIIEQSQEWAEKYCYNDDLGPLGGRIVWPYTADFLAMQLEEKPVKQEYVLQYGLSYKSFDDRALRRENIQFYDDASSEIAKKCLCYVCIDPSRGQVDPTCIWIWGLTHDKRKVWLDSVTKKLDPSKPEFWDILNERISRWEKFSQGVIEVRMEEAGPSTWCELATNELRRRGCYTRVVKVRVSVADAERKFKTRKADRSWARWAPMINRGEILFPRPSSKGGLGIRCDMHGDGNYIDLVDYFLDHELSTFPLSKTDNMLDAGGMIADAKANEASPLQYGAAEMEDGDDGYVGAYTSWMAP